jgi:hypothetical protein
VKRLILVIFLVAGCSGAAIKDDNGSIKTYADNLYYGVDVAHGVECWAFANSGGIWCRETK